MVPDRRGGAVGVECHRDDAADRCGFSRRLPRRTKSRPVHELSVEHGRRLRGIFEVGRGPSAVVYATRDVTYQAPANLSSIRG